MEHIRLFDWNSHEEDRHFVTADELDNSVTERILRNKFYDPLVYSSSEDEEENVIDWDSVFAKKKNEDNQQRVYVPGLHKPPQYPKKSELSDVEHFQCLKVLCQENPKILPTYFFARPTKADYKVYEQVKEKYEKEQKEYIEWAKTVWTNDQCMRALRPKPVVEQVYEAEFKMRAHEVQSFPKTWRIAAQIPLEMRSGEYQMVLQEDLIKVNMDDLQQIQYPDIITQQMSIMRPPSIPEPCTKHPCRFVLPGEKEVTILPLCEIHRILAQYAADYGAQYVASEGALKCLVDTDRVWTLPLSVCETIGADGEKSNIIVLGSEFAIHKESARTRMYRASRHLLQYALVPMQERGRIMDRRNKSPEKTHCDKSLSHFIDSAEGSSDDESDSLVIDPDYTPILQDTCDDSTIGLPIKKDVPTYSSKRKTEEQSEKKEKRRTRSSDISDLGIYTCTCKDTIFEKPPPRSFRKWLVKNNQNSENHEIIVHCSHKTKNCNDEEVILEPTVEYQLDLGASQLSESKIRTLALSLMLRDNASLLNVRVDNCNGDVVTLEAAPPALAERLAAAARDVAHTVYAALEQLRGLLPAMYMLHHEARYGANAMLLSACGADGAALGAVCDPPADEAAAVAAPAPLAPVLLPYHKYRRTLPCAFTPYQDQVAKEPKKPVARQKTPPQAIKCEETAAGGKRGKWPKKKRKNAKRNKPK